MSGRRARQRRKQQLIRNARGELPSQALQKARATRGRKLGEVAVGYREEIRKLYARWADERRRIWKEYDAQKDRIRARAARDKEKAAA